jgi:hypothetical protein
MATQRESLAIIIDEFFNRLNREPFKSLLDPKEAIPLLKEARRLLDIQNGEGVALIHLALDKVLSVINRALYTALDSGRLDFTRLTQIIDIIGTSMPIVDKEKNNLE